MMPFQAMRLRRPSSAIVPFTWNPADIHANLEIVAGTSNRTIKKRIGAAYASGRSTLPMPDGGYVEVHVTAGSLSPFMVVGLASAGAPLNNYIGVDTAGWGYYQDNGNKFHNAVSTAYGTSYTPPNVLGMCFKNGKLYFLKNNTPQGGGDPVAETGEAFSGLSGTLFVAASLYRADPGAHQLTIAAAAAQQTYAPPSGYFAPG